MLQDKINEIKPYFKSLESFNDALIVRVQFPKKWAVFPSDNGLIKPAPSERVPNEFYYYGDSNKVSLEDIFDFIKNTIEVNQSLEYKIKLLSEKTKELQKLFETKTLDELMTLQFTFGKKEKPKRKYTKKAKIEKKDNKNENNTVSAETTVKEVVASGNTEPKIALSASTLAKFKKAKEQEKK